MKDIYWISEEQNAKVAIVARPRGGDWLEADLVRMKHAGIDAVVSLLTAPEEQELGLAEETAITEQLGLAFFSYPIPDRNVPRDETHFLQFLAGVVELLRQGQAIGVHCRGCIGRATITAASLLMQRGWSASEALRAIEEARGCPVPDTEEQREWILALGDGHSAR